MRHSKIVKGIILAIQCGFGFLLLLALMTWSNIDAEQLAQRFVQAPFLPLVLGILFFIMTMILKALQYHFFLPSSVSIIYVVGVTLSQNVLLTFVPWRIGEMSYPLLLRRDHNIPLASSGMMILIIRLVDLLVVLTVVLVGGRKLGLDIHWVGITFGAAALLIILVVFTFVMWRKNSSIWLKTLISVFKPLCKPYSLAIFVMLSVSTFTLTTLQSTFILRAMALTVTLPDIALLNAVSLLAALLPIHPPGGWGTIDSIQILVLERLSYNPRTSSPAILAVHSFYTLLILAGGIVGWLLYGKNCSKRNVGL